MSNKDAQIKQLMDKLKAFEKGDRVDLSSEEDISIAVMNLISIEEHLFFSGGKTGQTKYYDMIEQVRSVRKTLMKMLVKQPDGEVWCISKHLLATSMRIMEVGTKLLTKGDNAQAHALFQKAYDIYMLFWSLNLNLIAIKDLEKDSIQPETVPVQEKDFFGRVSNMIGKMLDCCKE